MKATGSSAISLRIRPGARRRVTSRSKPRGFKAPTTVLCWARSFFCRVQRYGPHKGLKGFYFRINRILLSCFQFLRNTPHPTLSLNPRIESYSNPTLRLTATFLIPGIENLPFKSALAPHPLFPESENGSLYANAPMDMGGATIPRSSLSYISN